MSKSKVLTIDIGTAAVENADRRLPSHETSRLMPLQTTRMG